MAHERVFRRDRITAERLRGLLHYDQRTGVFTHRATRSGVQGGMLAGSAHSDGYIAISVDGLSYLAHRLAWLYVTGEWPTGEVDHKDRVRTHNWFDNLRDAGKPENMQNQSAPQKGNKTGFLGVYPYRGRFCAQIMANKVKHRLGTFDTPQEASRVYLEAKARLHVIA
jgi:hypothetical protein